MPDSAELMATADILTTAFPQPPSDARLRRAASTAYYAVFHHVARRAAVVFMPSANKETGGRALIHRSFDHGPMKQACKFLSQPVLPPKAMKSLGRTAVSVAIREFASSFGALQEIRHLADYDPLAVFDKQDVIGIIQSATDAIAAFDRAAPDEQNDVLAFLMAKQHA